MYKHPSTKQILNMIKAPKQQRKQKKN